MTTIIAKADADSRQQGSPSGEIPLAHVLQAYDVVLRQHSIVPEEDSHFYRNFSTEFLVDIISELVEVLIIKK